MKLNATRMFALVAALVASWWLPGPLTAQNSSENEPSARWWKGNLHTHSFWSDGTDFPDMIARWYYDRGYHFLALSDHNILSRGRRWMDVGTIESRGGKDCLPKYVDAFGDSWVEFRQIAPPAGDPEKGASAKTQGTRQVRLKTLNEIRTRFEQPDRFIMIEGEEISDSVAGLPVHMNATNLSQLLPPVGGSTVREAIDNNLRAAAAQAEKSGREMMVHLNHPNFGWAVTAEDIAWTTREQFIEIYNAHPAVNHLGDDKRPSVERIWDIVNTIRLDQLEAQPVFGLGVDDSHEYHGRPGSRPGRAWVMVRSQELDAESLIAAMYRGDFYSSSGVTLLDVRFDEASKTLSLNIDAAEGVSYETKFIGTRRDYDKTTSVQKDESGTPIRGTKSYSADVGAVLATSSDLTPKYHFRGDELYVRAVVTSSRAHPDPSFDNQFEQAWTQPVGWRK